jgi:hypothetical protein
MTEEEWLVCAESEKMSDYLFGRVSERKLMLLGCACCERIPHPATTPCLRQVLGVAESVAEGRSDREKLVVVAKDTQNEQEQLHQDSPEYLLFTGITCVTCGAGFPKNNLFKIGLFNLTAAVAQWTVPDVNIDPDDWGVPQDERWRKVWRNEMRKQAVLVREIFGNPFRPVDLNPAWLTSTVVALATGIYQDRAFDRMPILADALQDAGCENDDILNHCRQLGDHVRGCWVVDLILGKE